MQEVVAIDIGNSAFKLATRSTKSVLRIASQSSDQQLARSLSEFSAEMNADARWLVCCVDQQQATRLRDWVAKERPADTVRLIEAGDIKLSSAVTDREALGRDRLLASWYAATQTDPSKNTIVIDGGTAITIDVVDANRKHVGGLIFPGPRTILASLSEKTDALPDLAEAELPKLSDEIRLGTSTEPAILLGVSQSQLLGTIAIAEALEKQYAEAQVWCCGGVFEAFQSRLPKYWRFRSELLTEAIFHLHDTSAK